MNITTAASLLSRADSSTQCQWIDVRSGTEYAAGHIPGAVNIPMEQIEARLEDLRPCLPIVLVCQAGKRARMVAGLLEPCRKDVAVLEGGTAAWIDAGNPIVVNTKSRWSLERQVRLAAGIFLLTALVLAATVNRYWLGLAAFVGLGLTFAGLTDVCLMAALLLRLPWNRPRTTAAHLRKQPCSL
jgi:rhodanese-related sulfurtransferase